MTVPASAGHEHFCSACGSSSTTTTRAPEGSRHFARVTCDGCGRLVKWLPYPMSRERCEGLRLFFGPYAGRSLGEILAEDPGYVLRLASDSFKNSYVRRHARHLVNLIALDARRPSQPTGNGRGRAR